MLTSNLLTGSPSEGTRATLLWYLPGVSAFHFSCLEKSKLKWHKLFFCHRLPLAFFSFSLYATSMWNKCCRYVEKCVCKEPRPLWHKDAAQYVVLFLRLLFIYLLFNGTFNPPLSDRICLNNAYTFLSSVFIVRSRIYKNIWLKKESKNIFILNRFSLVIYLCGSLINAFSSC